ncbi:tetratricopeptide repeat protein [Clostridium frigidicarnis]|uniref:Tetratricopeptide repeat-containing protein n=1 Tax=Clostridium frigidicarnis TaxID=84698 RepID=A0A1I0YHL7_9CLOT|nr:Tetratricopeptide repeat-containing protein [Clostridium frigidicarnis]
MYSSVEEEEKAIECLNKIRKSYCDPNDILASIYIKQNKLNEARKILQGKLSKCIFDISIICISLANAYNNCEDELEIKEKYYKLSLDIKKCIAPYGDAILSSILEYFGLARLYLKHGDIEKALESLQTLVDNFEKGGINSIENKNNLWCFNELKLSNENSSQMNLYENIFCMLDDKMFDQIRHTIEFRDLIEKLNGLQEKSLGKRN